MREAAQAEPEITLRIRECADEAEAVRADCEARFPVGASTLRRLSVTGEPYVELAHQWADGYPTAAAAREAARAAFGKYAEGKEGTLYWRIQPDIAYGEKQRKFAYYMRLLISSKLPVVSP